jgi:outer membrane protein TolC
MKGSPLFVPVIVAVLSTGAAAQPAPAQGGTLSLDQAVRLAIENNPSLQSARLQVDKADDDLSIARTRRLPSFETQASASQLMTPVTFAFPAGALGVYPATGPIPAADINISSPRRPTFYVSTQVSQPLSRLVSIGLGIRAAATGRDVEREQLRAQQLSLINTVKRQYFAILQTESALAASTDAIALYRELDRTVQHRVVQKVALRAESLDVQFRLAQEELTRTTHANTLASQKERLNQFLGRDVRMAFEVEALPDVSAPDIDLAAAQTYALNSRPDVDESRLRLKQAEIDYRVKKANRIPEISLSVSYSSYFNMDVLPRNLATAGVQVKWEPFDWGRRGHELASRGRTIEQARRGVREAEDRAVVEVNTLFRKLAEARAMLDVVRAVQEVAREKLRVKTNEFQVQAALLSEVLQLRADVSSAEDRRQQALAAFWAAKADFDQAVGEEGKR